MHSTISKMSKHVEKLQKEAEEARDLLDAAKKKVGINEPPRGKTNNVVSEQVRRKPNCTVTEES